MATSNLNFTQSGGKYTATFVSGGVATIQMKRKKFGEITVSANIDGMDAVPVANLMDFDGDVIFNVDVPSGLKVTVTSGTEVTAAKIYTA